MEMLVGEGDESTPRPIRLRHPRTVMAIEATSADIWDPATNGWTPAGVTQVPRGEHAANLLPDGRALVTGGVGDIDLIEFYDPASGTWVEAGKLSDSRYRHATVAMDDGTILIVGGVAKEGFLALTEIYTP